MLKGTIHGSCKITCIEKEGSGKQNSREKGKVQNYPTQMSLQKYKLMKNVNILTKNKLA
jgi:hypothetical protein